MIDDIINLFVDFDTRERRTLCQYHTIKGNRDGIYFVIDIKNQGPTNVSFKRFSDTGDLVDIDESELTSQESDAVLDEIKITFNKAS